MMLRGESHSIRLKAAESILDRAGIVAEQHVEVDNQVTINVSYADTLELAKAMVTGEVKGAIDVGYVELPEGNGHTNGAEA